MKNVSLKKHALVNSGMPSFFFVFQIERNILTSVRCIRIVTNKQRTTIDLTVE